MNAITDLLRNSNLDNRTVTRLARVYDVADRARERGVMSWAERAARDARVLERIRDRDAATLDRLEDTFSHEFYRDYAGDAEPVYA
jgi:hypothetical protein